MSKISSNSLINVNLRLGNLPKSAPVLVKRISEVIGVPFKPWQIKRIAKAEAESKIIELMPSLRPP